MLQAQYVRVPSERNLLSSCEVADAREKAAKAAKASKSRKGGVPAGGWASSWLKGPGSFSGNSGASAYANGSSWRPDVKVEWEQLVLLAAVADAYEQAGAEAALARLQQEPENAEVGQLRQRPWYAELVAQLQVRLWLAEASMCRHAFTSFMPPHRLQQSAALSALLHQH